MIIGLNGKARSGKDLAFSLIKKHIPDAERLSFADKLKKSASALLGISQENLDIMKDNPKDYSLQIISKHQIGVPSTLIEMDFRTFLQRYGTESHRDVFDQMFWINALFPLDKTDDFLNSDNLYIITDVRFENEAKRIIDFGGEIWRIIRPETSLTNGHNSHRSETLIDSKYISHTVNNDGTIENFETELLVLLANKNLFSYSS